MKNSKFILFLLFFLSTTSFAEQWYHTYVPRSRYVNALIFLGTESILYGGGNEYNDSLQELWLSNDNGLEWENVNNAGSPPWIKSLAFTNTLKGLAVGYTGTIFKTVNGAYFWRAIATPINRQFNKIIYADTKTMYIAGGSVPRTDTLQTILKSIDSGNTWSIVRDTLGYWLKGIHFSDINQGIAVGDNGTILRTIDAGAHWQKITPPVVRNFNAVKFINSSVGYIVGGINYTDPFTLKVTDTFSTILRTNDGGASWNIIKDDSAGLLTDVTFSSNNIGYIAGDHGLVLKTTNAGLNWSPVVLPDIQPYTSFLCVQFMNDNLGMIGGRYGDVYVYTNSSLPSAHTVGAEYNESHFYKLRGTVNTHGEAGTYDFVYSLDSTFTTYHYAFYHSADVKTNVNAPVSFDLSGLILDTTYYFYIQARTLSGITNGDTLSFYSSKPTNIFEPKQESEGMKVYPNPTKDYLIVENLLYGSKECILSLMNLSGQLLKQTKFLPGQRTFQLGIADLSPGIYNLVLKKGDLIYNKKIVIQ